MPGPVQLPRPWDVDKDVTRLEKIRPMGNAIGIALDKASKAEGGPANPLSTDPRGNPDVLKRLRIKSKLPSEAITTKIHPLKLRRG